MGQAAVNLLLRKAVAHFDAGQPRQAESLCGDILTAQPDHVAALHLSAVIAFVTDRAAEGAVLLSRVFSVDPDHAPAFATLGDALAVKGEQEGAVSAFERAVTLQPQDASLHAKLGTALCDLSRFDAAASSYRRAIALDPNFVQARFHLAIVLNSLGRLSEAEAAYRSVIACDPAHRDAWLNLGSVLIARKKPDDAVAAYRHALTADADDPANLTPLRSLALALYEAGRPDEAVLSYRQASALDPGDPAILTDLGACLCRLEQFDEAIEATQRALALKPDHAPALGNLAAVLEARHDIDGAVAAHRRAVAADPCYAKGHANLAHALRYSGEIDEALAASHRAVTLDPDEPQARFNHAHFLLLNGEFEQGFVAYRWGRKCKNSASARLTFSQPEWQGEALCGRTLLLFAEAGLGDTLNFVRYVAMAAALGGGKIVLQVQPAIVPLLGTMPGVKIVGSGEPLPPFDLQLPLMSLARVFGTTVDTIPAAIPYLHADPTKLALWRRALGDAPSLKVGLVWAGNPMHEYDRLRSLSVEAVLPRLIMPGVQLYSLQQEPRTADIPALARLGADIIDLGPALGDFADTAAAIAALDLVIAVDTSVAHLAGALGRPVWLLLPYALDWRWLRDREDSPWYPTMRLFRQHKPQAWEGVLARASSELARVAAGERELIWPPSRADIANPLRPTP